MYNKTHSLISKFWQTKEKTMSDEILPQVLTESNNFISIYLSEDQKLHTNFRYANAFNRTTMGNYNATDLNIFHCILVEAKKYIDFHYSSIDLDSDLRFSIDFNELFELCSLDRRHNASSKLFNAVSEFVKKSMANTFQLVEANGKKITWTHFFTSLTFDLEVKKLYVAMSSVMIRSILLEFDKGYTEFEIIEFLSIKSKYAKLLYKLLKQYKTTGFFIISLKDLISILEIPASYKYNDIKKQILQKSIDELKSPIVDLIDQSQERIRFNNLKFEPIYNNSFKETKGRKSVEKIKFTFDKVSPPLQNSLPNK